MRKTVELPANAAAFSVVQAAVYIGISRNGVYRAFKSGALRPTKVGGRTLVRRVDADAFLARCAEAS
jgi:excisionase family DNA binding protein